MGKYTLSGTVDRFAGSTNGGTFQKSGNVFSIRRRAVPVQKQTPKQSQARNAFESQNGRWRQLTTGQKNSWITNAPSFTRINSVGVPYNFTGQNMHCGANQKRFFMQIGVTATGAGTIAQTTVSINLFRFTGFTNFFELSLSADMVETGFNVLYFATRQMPFGTIPTRPDFKLLGTRSQGNLTSTRNWRTDYLAVYSNLTTDPDTTIWVIAQIVQRSTGQVYQEVQGEVELLP